MTAQNIVDRLLETSAILDPLAAERYWRWQSKQHPRGPYRRGNAVSYAVNQLVKDIDASGRSMEGEPDEAQRQLERRPVKDTAYGMFRNSATMARNRNARRKSFGFTDTYSMRERGWPTAYRRPDGTERKRRKQPEIPVDEPQI